VHTVDDLYRLFLEREKAFQDKTQEIFATMDYLSNAIILHLEADAKDVKWISIDSVGSEIVIMVSIPSTDPNQYVPPSMTPSQLLTIVIPSSVVDTGESELIHQYLDETFDIRKHDGEDMDLQDLTGIIAASPANRRIVH